MHYSVHHIVNSFRSFGINHHAAPLEIREKHTLDEGKILLLLDALNRTGETNCFVLSTCNRTECYGFMVDPDRCLHLFLLHSGMPAAVFEMNGFLLTGEEAIHHLFKVSNGLDSKILGDYQVAGQMRKAVKLAAENLSFSSFTERLVQQLFQASRLIKNSTGLSDGAASVPYIAAGLVKEHCKNRLNPNVLVVGSGEVGQQLLRYLADDENLTVNILSRSRRIYDINGFRCHIVEGDIANLRPALNTAHVVVTALSGSDYCITSEMLIPIDDKLFIDLGVPRNIDPTLDKLCTQPVVTIDRLTENQTLVLADRKKEVRKAEKIIDQQILQWVDWLGFSLVSPVIANLKERLESLKEDELARVAGRLDSEGYSLVEKSAERIITKIINHCVTYIKNSSTTETAGKNLKEIVNF